MIIQKMPFPSEEMGCSHIIKLLERSSWEEYITVFPWEPPLDTALLHNTSFSVAKQIYFIEVLPVGCTLNFGKK